MPDKVSIQAVLVLYRQSLETSATWKALQIQVDAFLAVADFQLLVCDNGSVQLPLPPLPSWVEYIGIEQNLGLAWAYNRGLANARERGAAWLITLDQDTSLPPDYLACIAARAHEMPPQAGAIVPRLVSENGKVYSPVVTHWSGDRTITQGVTGIVKGYVRPYNSAAMVRTAALEAAGGYDRRFWMNYLDHATFLALQHKGYRIWIAGDLQVRHHLSLHEGRDRMSERHFRDFSVAESAFYDLHASWAAGLLFIGRLALRLVNQKRRRDPAHFSRTTREILKQRLILSKKQRLRRWEDEIAPRMREPRVAIHIGAASDTGSAS